ncbi:MAG: hypothetical protein ACOVSW_10215 [Candidatus Kapaibacteriota bacterium]
MKKFVPYYSVPHFSMRGTARRIIAFFFVITPLLCGLSSNQSYAQEKESGVMVGDYRVSGDLTLGYRSLSVGGVDGRSDVWALRRYYEAYNFREGIRLTDLNLFAERRRESASGLFDELYLTASGVGDPYTSVMLRMRTIKGYDLKISYVKSDYFLNRNDSLYTGLHKFDMRREMINASLAIPFSDVFGIELRYSGNGRSGTMTTTFSPHVEGVGATPTAFSGVFGPYTRDNFFWMNAPRNDWTNTFSGNIRLTLPAQTSINVGAGMRLFSQNMTFSPDSLTSLNYRPSATSLVPNTLGTLGLNLRNERLIQHSWQERRSNSTPFVFAEAVTKPTSWLSLTATARMEFLTNNGSVNGAWEGLVRRAANPATAAAPMRAYRFSETATVTGSFNRTLLSLLATARIADQLHFTVNYRYEQEQTDLTGGYAISIDTSANTNPVYRRAARDSVQNLEADFRSTIISHSISPQLVYTPLANLNLRAGVQYFLRTPTIRRFEEGASDSVLASNLSKRTTMLSPFFSAYYRPIRELRLRAQVHTYTNSAYWEGTSTLSPQYTRYVPDIRTTYGVSAEIDPFDNVTLLLRWDNDDAQSDFTLAYTNARLSAVRGDLFMRSKSLGLTASLSCTLNETTRFVVTGQYNDRTFGLPSTFTRGSVIFPTPPFGDSLTVLVSNNTIDRYLDASVTTTAIKNLRLVVGASYFNSTGGGGMTPETRPPTPQDVTKIGGPYTMLDIHGQAKYQIWTNLGVMVDYRYVLLNEVVSAPFTGLNNFAGNMILFSVVLGL